MGCHFLTIRAGVHHHSRFLYTQHRDMVIKLSTKVVYGAPRTKKCPILRSHPCQGRKLSWQNAYRVHGVYFPPLAVHRVDDCAEQGGTFQGRPARIWE